MKINKVSKKDILFSQEYLDSDLVDEYKKRYKNEPLEDSLPVLIKVCDKFLVKDGHHRISATDDEFIYCVVVTPKNIRQLIADHTNVSAKIEAKNFLSSFIVSSLKDRRSMMKYLHLVK